MGSKAPALQRGIDILQMIGQNGGSTSAQLEKTLNIPRASLNRFLDCLKENNFIDYSDRERNLSIGSELLHLVMTNYEHNSIVGAISPLLKRLAQQWQATFVFYRYREPFTIEWVAKQEPENGIKTMAPGFTTQCLNMNAQGQLFLSYLTDKKIVEYVNAGLARAATKQSLICAERLTERCQQIRQQGYAIQKRENNFVMQQIAVPLKLSGNDSIYALGCFLPLNFNETENLTEQMMFESSRLSGSE
jgi:DNA-binding IclR family transcriptional regulator